MVIERPWQCGEVHVRVPHAHACAANHEPDEPYEENNSNNAWKWWWGRVGRAGCGRKGVKQSSSPGPFTHVPNTRRLNAVQQCHAETFSNISAR